MGGELTWLGAASAAWVLISACVNFVFWWHSPEEWVAFCEAQPRAAAVIKVFRALGVDPVRFLVAVREFVAAQKGPRR